MIPTSTTPRHHPLDGFPSFRTLFAVSVAMAGLYGVVVWLVCG